MLDKVADIFLISLQKTYVVYYLEAPCRGASNEYPQHMFLWRNKSYNVDTPSFLELW